MSIRTHGDDGLRTMTEDGQRKMSISRVIYTHLVPYRPRSLVVRASARESGGRFSVPDRVTPKMESWEVCTSQFGTNELGNRLAGSESVIMVEAIPFCSPMAELSRLLGTLVRRRSFSSNKTGPKLAHHTYNRIHLHTPLNTTCSRWYDLERLKADFKTWFTPTFM